MMRKEGQKTPRKTYAKPCIMFEDFTLNQFIANCTINTNESDWLAQLEKYSYLDYVSVVRYKQFGYKMVCENNADDIAHDGDTVCYHSSTSPLFTS